jgi:isoaspartyl peptidase/L-asparaginase-like protein (Ntn-hydrolase superfamily)
VVVVHGGAWAVPDSLEPASRAGVRRAAAAAYKVPGLACPGTTGPDGDRQVLESGGSALEAVTEAVSALLPSPRPQGPAAGGRSCI